MTRPTCKRPRDENAAFPVPAQVRSENGTAPPARRPTLATPTTLPAPQTEELRLLQAAADMHRSGASVHPGLLAVLHGGTAHVPGPQRDPRKQADAHYFPRAEDLMAAIEAHNSGLSNAYLAWHLQRVQGRHRKGCDECARDLNGEIVYFRQGLLPGVPTSGEKRCLGCIGRMLKPRDRPPDAAAPPVLPPSAPPAYVPAAAASAATAPTPPGLAASAPAQATRPSTSSVGSTPQ